MARVFFVACRMSYKFIQAGMIAMECCKILGIQADLERALSVGEFTICWPITCFDTIDL